MVICEKYKVIFYHIPKTAGTSIKTILINEFGGVSKQTHIAARYTKDYVKNYNDYIKFAVVRNPYSRAVSWYNHLLRESEKGRKASLIIKPDSFEQFVKKQERIYNHRVKLRHFGLWSTQYVFLLYNDNVITDYILNYENLEEDFRTFSKVYFGKTFELPHKKNWGVQDNYEDFYTPELKEIIYNRMKKDFEYFGYEKDFN